MLNVSTTPSNREKHVEFAGMVKLMPPSDRLRRRILGRGAVGRVDAGGAAEACMSPRSMSPRSLRQEAQRDARNFPGKFHLSLRFQSQSVISAFDGDKFAYT